MFDSYRFFNVLKVSIRIFKVFAKDSYDKILDQCL